MTLANASGDLRLGENPKALADAIRSRQKAALAIGLNDLVIDSRIAAAPGNELSTLNRREDRQRSSLDRTLASFEPSDSTLAIQSTFISPNLTTAARTSSGSSLCSAAMMPARHMRFSLRSVSPKTSVYFRMQVV